MSFVLSRSAVNAAALALVVAGAAAGCSKSTHTPTAAKALQSAVAQAAGGASNGAAGASTGAAGGASTAAAAGNTLLAGNPGCKLLSASDVKAAAGIDLGDITGNISGGM